MSDQELMLLAEKARENAYVPYSDFKVGAALLCSDGSVYLGCNVENASYGATMCAERTAVFSAIADGKRAFLKIAVCGGNDHADVPVSYPHLDVYKRQVRGRAHALASLVCAAPSPHEVSLCNLECDFLRDVWM